MKIPLNLLRRPPKPEPTLDDAARPMRAPAHERAAGAVNEATRRLYQVISLVLDYPSEHLLDRLMLLRATVEHDLTTGGASRTLLPLLEHLATTPPARLQSDYVETFDLRRRCCLHLSYYAHGDTRRRGMALLDIKQAYQHSGVDLSDAELPDHLCVLLEFTATVDPGVGRVLLLDNRPGIELLRISLAGRGSPYACAVEALTATFPPLAGDDAQVVRNLIAAGPPDEEVGMEAYSSGSVPPFASTPVRS